MQCLKNWSECYGDPFTLGLGSKQPSVFFGHPEAIRKILTAQLNTYKPRRGPKVLLIFLGRHAPIHVNGSEHQSARRLLAPPFQGERILSSCKDIRKIADNTAESWVPGESFKARDFAQEVTLRVIFNLVLGSHQGRSSQLIKHELMRGVSLINHRLFTIVFLLLPPWSLRWLSPWNRLIRVRQNLEAAINKEIDERLAKKIKSAQPDVLDQLLADFNSREPKLSIEKLTDQIITLLFAGHETTASALGWALALIYENQEVLDKLRQELDAQPDISERDLLRLPYLSAVCNEVLRLYPGPIEVPRVLEVPMEIQGYIFPAGTRLVPCMQLTHRRSDIFEDPLKFQPERFLTRSYSPHEFWPFGEGSRKCLGMSLALIELKLIIASIVMRWELKVISRVSPWPVRRGVFVAPPESLTLRVMGKRNATTLPAQPSNPS